MCFSFEVSIATFITSWSISFYLLSKKLTENDKKYIIALMIYSSMQLLDAILWYIKMKKNNINYIITSLFIPTLLSLQILYNVFIINENNNIYITIITIISLIYLYCKFNGYSKSLCSNNNNSCNDKLLSPIWGSNEIKLWELIIFTIIVFYPNYNIILFTILIYFPLMFMFFDGAYGSMWCAMGNIFSIIYLYNYKYYGKIY